MNLVELIINFVKVIVLFSGEELFIQSTNLITSNNLPIEEYAGMHYCKILSPAKALEFIYVDALYVSWYHE